MSPQKHMLNWDDTIKPAKPFSLSHNFNGLSLSPENKRKRRHEDAQASTQPLITETHNTASQSLQQDGPAHLPHAKRSRISQPSRRSSAPLSTRRRLEALDKSQLMALVEDLVDHQPQLCYTIDNVAPPLTSSQALSVLQKYLAEVEAHLPYGSGHSDYAFLRVKPQWTSFFVALAEYTHFFLENGHTDMTKMFEFLDGATNLVHSAPVWDSADNNALLARAYGELGEAWTSLLSKAQEALSYIFIGGSAWEARFQDHCRRSKGRMADRRDSAQVEPVMMRIPEGVTG